LLAGGGLAGGGLAGGVAAGAAPEGAAAGAALLPDGLAIEPELSDGAAAGALLEAGGAAAGSVLEDGFFAQAVSSKAAASALRATLVFIDRYPETLREPIRESLVNEFFIVLRVLHRSRGRIL
jgi:hypothetical protein